MPGTASDPEHIYLEGEEPSIALSEEAREWLDTLNSRLATEFQDARGPERGEIAVDTKAVLDCLDKQRYIDANMTPYQKAQAWTMTWAIIDRVGLLRLAAGTCLDDQKVALSIQGRDKPVGLYLSKQFITWLYRTVYYAACASLTANVLEVPMD